MGLRFLWLIFATLLVADSVFAMRCGNKLVDTGDSQFKVYKLCGEPAFVKKRTIHRSGLPRTQYIWLDNSFSDNELLFHQRSHVEVLVEEWTYNFGPNRFIRQIRFEDGIVVKIDTQGYGYPE